MRWWQVKGAGCLFASCPDGGEKKKVILGYHSSEFKDVWRENSKNVADMRRAVLGRKMSGYRMENVTVIINSSPG